MTKKAGIGNKKIYRIKSEKDIVINTRNAVFTEESLAMTQGVEVLNDDEVEVTRVESFCLEEGQDEIELEGNPEGDVNITDATGTVIAFTPTGKVVVLSAEGDFADMEEIEVVYKEKVKGNSIEFDAEKFSKNVKLEMRTIAYDLNTSEVYSDIYFIFPNCSVSDDYNISFEAGTVLAPEISFDVLQPRCGSAMGKMINVPRNTP